MKIINAKIVKKSLEEEYLLSQKKTQEEWNKIYKKFNELLRQKKWTKAYDVYVEFIEKYNIINEFIYTGLVQLLKNIKYLQLNDDNIDKIFILLNNFTKYFTAESDVIIITQNIIIAIDNNKNLSINKLFDLGQELYDIISTKHSNICSEELHTLNLLLHDIYFMNMAHMYTAQQIIMIIEQIINKSKYNNNDYVKTLYISILISLKLYTQALEICNTIVNIDKQSICKKIILSHSKKNKS